jgi:hypothetical protein
MAIACVGTITTSAAASPTRAEQGISTTSSHAQAGPTWNRSAGDNFTDCNVARMFMANQGYPTDPTSGCYREPGAYYFFWWG